MMKKISILLPFYNEEKNLPHLIHRIHNVIKAIPCEFEYLFVDDGSSDRSAEYIKQLMNSQKGITLIELSRNFGHQTAVYAGLQHAKGDAVIIADTDLQDRPEAFSDFIKYWEEGFDVVYAIRKDRKENHFKRIMFSIFYKILNRISEIPIPVDAGLFSLIDRKVIKILADIPERNRYIPGLRAWTGFKQIGIEIEREERGDKIPKVSLLMLFRLAMDALISFSWIPLRISMFLGIFAIILSTLGAGIVLYKKYISMAAIPGWTSTLLSIFFFGSIQLIIFGIIGEYIGRIYEEVKRRPPYVIKEITGSSDARN